MPLSPIHTWNLTLQNESNDNNNVHDILDFYLRYLFQEINFGIYSCCIPLTLAMKLFQNSLSLQKLFYIIFVYYVKVSFQCSKVSNESKQNGKCSSESFPHSVSIYYFIKANKYVKKKIAEFPLCDAYAQSKCYTEFITELIYLPPFFLGLY